ncbi:MAG: sialate O-acetylesterase [Planctomycetes bacterium]|nr:sialate O-acetylesterase [Planctomycetota bacterium]
MRNDTGLNYWRRAGMAALAVMTLTTMSLTASALRADVKLPAIFSDHMVLQADTGAPIWGWADPGEQVVVTIGTKTITSTAGADGRWQARMSKLPVSAEPMTLTVKGKNTFTVNDVLVGEVWLASGQSNMGMLVSGSLDYEKEQAAARHPQLRMFTVARNPQPKAQSDCQGTWVVCAPETVGRFSATAYFFGRDLQAELKQPLGLINSSYGGTTIEAWTSIAAQSKLPAYAQIAEPWAKRDSESWDQAAEDAKYQQQLAAWKEKAKQLRADGKEVPRQPRAPVQSQFDQNHPGNLFNGMIEPIIPYGCRGAIWYQGEGNSGKPYAAAYGDQLRMMIAEWRGRFDHDFPFAWVQLPDFRQPQTEADAPGTWPIVREQMLKTLSVPNTGMAVALGLGEPNDIHPRNKQGVGKRLAAWALVDVYHRSGESSGPLYAGSKIVGETVEITLTHADGLRARDGTVKGFVIAGADKKFVWADARIEGNKVLASSPQVKSPVAVRYAWADNPVWSLENTAGIPASPFRTDEW